MPSSRCRDLVTGEPKGYAFFSYSNPSLTSGMQVLLCNCCVVFVCACARRSTIPTTLSVASAKLFAFKIQTSRHFIGLRRHHLSPYPPPLSGGSCVGGLAGRGCEVVLQAVARGTGCHGYDGRLGRSWSTRGDGPADDAGRADVVLSSWYSL